MARRKQVFEAPENDKGLPLPIGKAWNYGRSALVPAEHWEVIIEFAQKQMPKFGELLEEASYLDGDFSEWTNEKTLELYEGLDKLRKLIAQSEPLTPEIKGEILENHPPEAHIEMIEAFMLVIEESQRMGEMFDSYIDS